MWKPTHRLTATLGNPRTVHCWLVVLDSTGNAYTRRDIEKNLLPTFQRLADTQWLYHNLDNQKTQIITSTLKELHPDSPTFLPTPRAMRKVS